MRIGDRTPWSTEQLLARSAAQWVGDLIAFEPTDRLGPSRGGLLLSVEEAATRQFDWGIELSDALIDDSQWDSDLWTALLRAWSKSELNDQQRQRVLERLRSADLREAQVVPIADFLCESHKPVPSPRLNESLDPANELAADMWDRLSETAPQANQTHDWLTQAINHPAGNLAQFWVYSLWHSANQRDPKPQVLGRTTHFSVVRHSPGSDRQWHTRPDCAVPQLRLLPGHRRILDQGQPPSAFRHRLRTDRLHGRLAVDFSTATRPSPPSKP